MTATTFQRVLLFVALTVGLVGASADGDLWGHVRFGQDLVAQHHVVSADPYSFTSDRPWVNHEWLAEVAMAGAFAAAGPLGLNLIRIGCLALIVLLVWRRLAPFRAPPRIFDALLVVTTLGVYERAQQVRPQVFSLVFFALLLALLTDADRRADWRRLIVVPPLMALWANVHGGWIVGMQCLAIWLAGKIVLERRSIRERAILIALGVASFLMTALNPYGPGLWTFLRDTVSIGGRAYIEDWQPVYRLGGFFWVFWLLPAALASFAAYRSRLRLPLARAAIVLFLGAGALMVSRLDAFFSLAVVFLLAEPLAENWPERPDPRERSRPVLQIATALMVLAAIPLSLMRAERIQIGHPPMPEPEASDFVTRTHLHGNVLVWFDWGEYVIWHFSPQLRVSMDGRRETVYSQQVIDDHMAFYLGTASAIDLPSRINADYIWVPTWIPVVAKLKAKGWSPIFEGPRSTILARSGSGIQPVTLSASNARSHVFPGP